MERRNLGLPSGIRLERRQDEEPKIVGYAAIFYDGTAATEFELWPGMVERILPGAFDRALREDDIRALFNHENDNVLGRTSAGTLRLSVDQKGLSYEITPPATALGRDLTEMIGRGDISGSSIGFIATDEEFARENEVWVRSITGMKLFDLGPVTFPAFEATTADIRSADPGTADAMRSWARFMALEEAEQKARASARNARVKLARLKEVALEISDR